MRVVGPTVLALTTTSNEIGNIQLHVSSLILVGKRFRGGNVFFEREDFFEGEAQPNNAYASEDYDW